MYNHLPRVDPTRSFGGGHRARESEEAALRRMHREHVAATRIEGAVQASATGVARRILTRPAAILALVGLRR